MTKAELEAKGFRFPSIDELLEQLKVDDDSGSDSDCTASVTGEGANYAVPGMYQSCV